jgi:hypothetical protein
MKWPQLNENLIQSLTGIISLHYPRQGLPQPLVGAPIHSPLEAFQLPVSEVLHLQRSVILRRE